MVAARADLRAWTRAGGADPSKNDYGPVVSDIHAGLTIDCGMRLITAIALHASLNLSRAVWR